MSDAPKIRLFVDQALAEGVGVALSRDQAHYLFGVMRQSDGAGVLVFNGRDGEFLGHVTRAGKRGGALTVAARTKEVQLPPDLWLLFAPIKKARTDFIVEKAAEMGAARICPVSTDFTNAERIRRDRLQAHAIEAAEQCGGTFVPEVAELTPLDRMLADWPADRRLLFADETQLDMTVALENMPSTASWAVLIGPEGGFSDRERAHLNTLPFVTPISLGPRVLRADTAAVAALTLFQSTYGDWV